MNKVFNVSADFEYVVNKVTYTTVGSIVLTRSTDGGATFAPITAGAYTPSRLSSNAAINVAPGDATTQFRLECSIISGQQIAWSVRPSMGGMGGGYGPGTAVGVVGLPVRNYVRTADRVPWTAAQMQTLYEAIFKPLSAADLANLTTGYTTGYFTRTNPDGSHTRDTAYVKLSFASSDRKDFSSEVFVFGGHRWLRAQSATVVSVVDGAGNAVPSATTWMDTSLVFAPGPISVACYSRNTGNVTPNDFTRCYDPSNKNVATVNFQGALQNGNASIGIEFFESMAEAIDISSSGPANTDGPNPGKYPPLVPNPTALGL